MCGTHDFEGMVALMQEYGERFTPTPSPFIENSSPLIRVRSSL